MSKPIQLETENLDATAPLFCQYPSQINCQPAYVEIDPRGPDIAISADYSGEVGGGMPAAVWNGAVTWVGVSPQAYGPALADALKSEDFRKKVLEFCESDSEEEKTDLYFEMEDALRDIERAEVYNDAREYIEPVTAGYDTDGEFTRDEDETIRYVCDGHEISDKTTDSSLEQIAADLKLNMDEKTYVMDLLGTLIDLRDRCVENAE